MFRLKIIHFFCCWWREAEETKQNKTKHKKLVLNDVWHIKVFFFGFLIFDKILIIIIWIECGIFLKKKTYAVKMSTFFFHAFPTTKNRYYRNVTKKFDNDYDNDEIKLLMTRFIWRKKNNITRTNNKNWWEKK